MKISVLTLGCKTNQAESSLLEANFQEKGWSIVGLEERPDFCIVNTCSVTAKTDYQSRQLIRRAQKAGSKVVVTGCYAQLNRESVASMDGVFMVVGNSAKALISDKLSGLTSGTTFKFASSDKSRLFVKVQDGCDGSCSYCIIPKARGASRSIEPDPIIREIRDACLVYNEVVLTGIHLGTYGYDLHPKVSLSSILKRCMTETAIRRIRLSSLEINELDGELIDLLRDPRICKHLHIPLQSGDDGILQAMNRAYAAQFFAERIAYIQSMFTDICIGTDIIVGFPGESEGAFYNTYNLLESLPISYFHVFPFSPRPGTKASFLEGRITPQTLKDRCSELRRLSERKKALYMRSQIGKTLEVLVEERQDKESIIGTTGNYLKVRAFIAEAVPKDLVTVGVAGVEENYLVAHPI